MVLPEIKDCLNILGKFGVIILATNFIKCPKANFDYTGVPYKVSLVLNLKRNILICFIPIYIFGASMLVTCFTFKVLNLPQLSSISLLISKGCSDIFSNKVIHTFSVRFVPSVNNMLRLGCFLDTDQSQK